jgi:hypothetical protein
MKRSPGLGRFDLLTAVSDSTELVEVLSNGYLLAGLPIPNRTVACTAFVSITVARQQGNCTPFRFFIPVL